MPLPYSVLRPQKGSAIFFRIRTTFGIPKKKFAYCWAAAYFPSIVIYYPNLDRAGLNSGASMLPSSLPPGPKLSLKSFDGDVIKYWGFKQWFRRHIVKVYANWKDRITFL